MLNVRLVIFTHYVNFEVRLDNNTQQYTMGVLFLSYINRQRETNTSTG